MPLKLPRVMRRKKAARKAGPSKPLSAHEAGKISRHKPKPPATVHRGVKYDDETSYKPAETLTVREEEILSFVADDQNNDAIAKREKISESTVEKHIENIFKKIPVKTRASAVAWYWKRRWAALEKRIQRES
ncbi:MAG TPA: helix-turn-helix transcriptional regulator [Chthoniobacterales bacterium]|nr:helix-turn-helix transcriptional regulator [Chthoniobacterales bacterium]